VKTRKEDEDHLVMTDF